MGRKQSEAAPPAARKRGAKTSGGRSSRSEKPVTLNLPKLPERPRSGLLPPEGQPVTEENILLGMKRLAMIIHLYGDAYVPLFEALERGLEEIRKRKSAAERARRFLEDNPICVRAEPYRDALGE